MQGGKKGNGFNIKLFLKEQLMILWNTIKSDRKISNFWLLGVLLIICSALLKMFTMGLMILAILIFLTYGNRRDLMQDNEEQIEELHKEKERINIELSDMEEYFAKKEMTFEELKEKNELIRMKQRIEEDIINIQKEKDDNEKEQEENTEK